MMNFFFLSCVFIFGFVIGTFYSSFGDHESPPVATFSGGTLTLLDLEAHIDPELQSLQSQFYRRLTEKIQSLIYDKMIQGPETFINPEDIVFNELEFKKYLNSQNVKMENLTKKEYLNYFENYRLKVAQKKVDEYVNSKKNTLNLQITLPKPILPRLENQKSSFIYSHPKKWNQPEFILVQNYTCAHCADSFSVFQKWQEKYKDDLKFGILVGGQSFDSMQSYISKLASCASAKDLTREFHDRFFKLRELNQIKLSELVAALHLDPVEKCADERFIKENPVISKRPYFLVDGYLVDYAEDPLIIDSLVKHVR